MDKNQIFGVDGNGDPFKGGGDGGAAGDVTHSSVLRELQVENLTSYCGGKLLRLPLIKSIFYQTHHNQSYLQVKLFVIFIQGCWKGEPLPSCKGKLATDSDQRESRFLRIFLKFHFSISSHFYFTLTSRFPIISISLSFLEKSEREKFDNKFHKKINHSRRVQNQG